MRKEGKPYKKDDKKPSASTISQNLRNYIDLTEERNKSHRKAAVFWDKTHQWANIAIIILTSVATIFSVMEGSIPNYVVPIVTGFAAMVSSMVGVFKPFERHNLHVDSSRNFQLMMLRLVSCEKISEYKEVRKQIQETLLTEPFAPTSKKKKDDDEEARKKHSEVMWALSSKLKIEIFEEEQEWKKFKQDVRNGKWVSRRNQPQDDTSTSKVTSENSTTDGQQSSSGQQNVGPSPQMIDQPDGPKSSPKNENPVERTNSMEMNAPNISEDRHREETSVSRTINVEILRGRQRTDSNVALVESLDEGIPMHSVEDLDKGVPMQKDESMTLITQESIPNLRNLSQAYQKRILPQEEHIVDVEEENVELSTTNEVSSS
uniref:SMODS and SLOG-associating 2TM effector domain-containing protein n=1 Tax=Clytia hemisphaerica TaxID=252671 RepID=A0A7M5V710_9CNID